MKDAPIHWPQEVPARPTDDQAVALALRWEACTRAVAAHPAFPDALSLFANRVRAIYAGDRQIHRVLGQHRHYGVAALVLVLDHRARQAGAPPPCQSTLVTLGKLAGIGTRRGIRNIIDVQVHRGLLSRRSGTDRRMQLLAPAPRLRAHFAATLAARLSGAALVCPDLAGGSPDAILPTYLEQLVLPLFQLRTQPAFAFPEIAPFAGRLGGYVLLFGLLADSLGRPGGSGQPLNVSASASDLGISRTQVLKLLKAAADAGVLTWADGELRWSAPARERLLLFAAMELARALCAAESCREQQ